MSKCSLEPVDFKSRISSDGPFFWSKSHGSRHVKGLSTTKVCMSIEDSLFSKQQRPNNLDRVQFKGSKKLVLGVQQDVLIENLMEPGAFSRL